MATKQKEVEKWITVNGVHVPVFKGQSVEEAVKKVTGEKKGEVSTTTHHYTKSELQDATFRKEALEEMRRYERNWDYYTAKEKRNISPAGKKVLQERIKEIEDYEKSSNQISKDQDLKAKQIADNEKQAKEAGGKTSGKMSNNMQLRSRIKDLYQKNGEITGNDFNKLRSEGYSSTDIQNQTNYFQYSPSQEKFRKTYFKKRK